ncbi:hypothetical protein HPB49_005602 [Dermacentor silvarum]|uniref:Uncharacterized protein n=1 Tax=Dermacentor silvarum TaxID=543639 RepID=A0ACB8DW20_DERSI|nr:hypothetical protein HPB49_005602 [Dermacentor silvarum]
MEDLLLALKHRYLPKQPAELPPPYSGQPNAELDEDIQLCEVTAAIQKLRKHTAPGADQISNKILANLDNLWNGGPPLPCTRCVELRYLRSITPRGGRSA